MKLILVMLLVLTACGESPLLNHRMENNSLVKNTSFSESEVLKFKKTNYSFIVSWEEGPKMGVSRFLMKTWKKDSGTLSGPYQDLDKNLHIFLWMPSMGHGSAPVKIKKIDEGEYEVSDVHFIMGGKWEIKFQLKNGNQVLDEVVVPLSL